jgi:hypothetical protein
MSSISDDKKVILMELLRACEDEFNDFLHNIEEDKNVPNDSWYFIDNQSKRLFEIFRTLYEEIYYT